MDIQLFQTFLLVAKLNNITQAAEQLNFTQPAVSAQIRTLEDHYGISLFERIGKKLYITEAGCEMKLHSEKLLTAYNNINIAMQKKSGFEQPIKVGASTTVASYIFPSILLDFQKLDTGGSVTVDICPNLPTTIKGLLDNTYDIAIVHNKINNAQLTQFDFSREKLVWIARSDLVAANNNSKKISSYQFINFRPGCVYRDKFEKVVQEADIHSLIEYSDAEAIKRAVLDGVGASILPYRLVEEFLADGILLELSESPALTFVMSVVFQKSKILTPAAQSLLAVFAAHADIAGGLTEYLHNTSIKE